jgi:hypothetical protein
MNRSTGESSNLALNSLEALRPAPAAQAAQPADGATLAFGSGEDAAQRVLNQLDGLTSTLEKANQANTAPAAAATGEPPEEECLESYLQRYMQQLTGKKENPAVTTPMAGTSEKSKPEVEEPKPAPRQPVQAPEDRLRITAMRELANDSARRAMAERSSSQLFDKTRTTYLVTKVVSLISITLAVCYFSTHSTIALASAAVTFGVACLSACRFALFCRRMGQGAEPA